jgi:nicotinic acid mononucleotide adenylyltransferase/nicotinamide mononucleotide (NMN) deamidase PncC
MNQISDINDSSIKLYYAATGGGYTFISDFMSQSGASKTIIGTEIPYSTEALEYFCGVSIQKYCSAKTATLMAEAAFTKGIKFGGDINTVGIGVTCALTTQNERENREHKVYISIHTIDFTCDASWVFTEDAAHRDVQDHLISVFVRKVLHDIALGNVLDKKYLPETVVQDYVIEHYDRLKTTESIFGDNIVIYPGSWNPYHDGHKAITDLAEKITNTKLWYELAVDNADKGSITKGEIVRRIKALPRPCIVTEAPTFIEKARLLTKPGRKITFVVGADTWERFIQPHYAGSIDSMILELIRYNVKFLVFGRYGKSILTGTTADALLQYNYAAHTFNNPISSSGIREQQD